MKKTRLILIVSGLIIIGLFYSYSLYNKSHKDILASKAEFKLTATELIANFGDLNKDFNSNALYDKIITVSGEITLIEEGENSVIIILNNGVKCEIDTSKNIKHIKKNKPLKIKGIFSGFDEMFNEITLVKCHVIN